MIACTLFALLVCDAAGCFASRLAGGLAFAAAAVLQAFLKVARLNGDYSFHIIALPDHYSLNKLS